MTEPLLTADDVCRLLRLHRNTVLRWAATGRLPAVKVGRDWRFHKDDIERVMQEGTR